MTGCSCLKNELWGMVWALGERECTRGVPSRISSPLACFTCIPALLPAQSTKTILKILKTPRWLGNPCISRLNGAPLLLAGQAGLILNILKTLSSPEPAGDYRPQVEVPPENIWVHSTLRAALKPAALLAFFAWHEKDEPAAALPAPRIQFPPGSKSSRMRRWCHRGIRECDVSPVREKCLSDFAFCVWCVRCGKNKSGEESDLAAVAYGNTEKLWTEP